MRDRYDVIVVGARVAGSTLAALLGDAGVSVLLLDRARFPSTTPSTHFFRGAGMVGVLGRLGVLDAVLALGCPPLTRQFDYEDGAPDRRGGPAPGAGRGRLLPLGAASAAGLHPAGAGARGGDRRGRRARAGARAGVGRRPRGRRGARGWPPRARRTRGRRRRSPLARRQAGERQASPTLRRRCAPSTTATSPASPAPAASRPTPPSSRCSATRSPMSSRATRGSRAWRSRSTSRRSAGCAAISSRAGTSVSPATAVSSARVAAATPAGRLAGCGPEHSYVRVPYGPGWALVGDAAMHQDPWSGLGMDMRRRPRDVPRRGDRRLAPRIRRRADGAGRLPPAPRRPRAPPVTTRPCATPPTCASSPRVRVRVRASRRRR